MSTAACAGPGLLLSSLSSSSQAAIARTPDPPRPEAIVLERIRSPEISLTGKLGSDAHSGRTLQLHLRNVGSRTLVFDTGVSGYPMANFAFSLELPDHSWLALFCHVCMPGAFSQPLPYTVRLRPLQFLIFIVPLSTFVAADPHTGTALDLQMLHGRIRIELQVPAPAGATKRWPGYVSAVVPLA